MASLNYSIATGNLTISPNGVIASGQTNSSTIATNGAPLVGIQMPAAFTGTAITFLVSQNGVLFQSLHTGLTATLLSYTVAAGYYVAINPVDFYGVAFIQIVSNQVEGASRTFNCSLKGI